MIILNLCSLYIVLNVNKSLTACLTADLMIVLDTVKSFCASETVRFHSDIGIVPFECFFNGASR